MIDPRQTHFAERADLHLQPRPGSDGALALGMLKVIVDENLFDREFVKRWTVGFPELRTLLDHYSLEELARITWVSEDAIRQAARLYAQTRPACLFVGQALDQHEGSAQTIRAVTSLMAICGYLDVPGGNVLYPPTRLAKNPLELHDKLPPHQASKRLGNQFLLTDYAFTRLAHPPSGFKAVLEETPYAVKAMFIMAANPVVTEPNSNAVKTALGKLDFLTVVDTVMSQTAQLADVVLPASTFVEQTYYATYEPSAHAKPSSPGLMVLRPQVIPPLGESWPDWKIIFELGRRLGYGQYFPWRDIEEAIDDELRPTGITVHDLRAHPEGIRLKGMSLLYQRFASKGVLGRLIIGVLNRTVFRTYPRMYGKYRLLGFMTPSKKVELRSAQLARVGLDGLPVYHEPAESPEGSPELARSFPLVLTTGGKPQWFVHSQMREATSLHRNMPRNCAEVHPDTAADFEIADGEPMFVESPRGRIECQAKLTRSMRSGVVHVFPGFAESNANVLTDNCRFDPITGSAPLGAALCRIGPVALKSPVSSHPLASAEAACLPLPASHSHLPA